MKGSGSDFRGNSWGNVLEANNPVEKADWVKHAYLFGTHNDLYMYCSI
jgi:hypothetical protein